MLLNHIPACSVELLMWLLLDCFDWQHLGASIRSAAALIKFRPKNCDSVIEITFKWHLDTLLSLKKAWRAASNQVYQTMHKLAWQATAMACKQNWWWSRHQWEASFEIDLSVPTPQRGGKKKFRDLFPVRTSHESLNLSCKPHASTIVSIHSP